MAAAIICFERYRAERVRQRAHDRAESSGPVASPFRDRLVNTVLNARQIAHRRAMVHFASQRLGLTQSSLKDVVSERE
jgi:hypothetical protein